MHIKQSPDDFVVEEQTTQRPGTQGPFAFYRLEKRGWTTPDALRVIRRRWDLPLNRVSYGGLKDRHAHTIQFLSIFRGPQRNLNQQGIQVTYLGQIDEPYTSRQMQANRFRLTIRDMTADDAATAHAALEEARRDGVPNYFDDQRFGSVGAGQFLARHIILGEYEAALKLALAAPYRHDRAAEKKEKAALRAGWGHWSTLKERLPRGHARSLVDYLASHPQDFRGAIARLRPELRGLYLSAYQSHLWNRLLAAWLHANVPAAHLLPIPLRFGPLPMHRNLEAPEREALAQLSLPLPSARVELADDDPRRPLFERILHEEKLEPAQFKLKGLPDLFFTRGERPALCLPSRLEGATERDELHPQRQKMTLAYELPRGSYATLLVKRITRLPDAEGD